MTHHLVVCGFDGTDETSRAAEWAARWARRRQWELQLVGVHGTVAASPGEARGSRLVSPETTERSLKNLLDARAEALRARHEGLAVSTWAVVGTPADVLTDLSETVGLLVVGSRGLGPRLGPLAGSVAQSVLARGHGALMVVPDSDPPADDAPIVLALDPRGRLSASVHFAFDQAAADGRSIVAVHAVTPTLSAAVGVLPTRSDALDAARDACIAKLMHVREDYPEVDVEVRVRAGMLRDHLVAESKNAAMVVVGNRDRGAFLSVVQGTTGRSLVRDVRVPVAVVKDWRRWHDL